MSTNEEEHFHTREAAEPDVCALLDNRVIRERS